MRTLAAIEAHLAAIVGELQIFNRRLLAIEQAVLIQGTTTMSKLDGLADDVTKCLTVGDSMKTLMEGLAAEIASTSDDAAIQALAAKVKAKTDEWSAAVIANTPAATPATAPAAPPAPDAPPVP